MNKSRMRSIALVMVVALTASVSASAATVVDGTQPSDITFATPAAITATTQATAVASAPASTQSFVCPPSVVGGPDSPSIRVKDPCYPPPPPPTGYKPDQA